jgi:hypothetical protein
MALQILRPDSVGRYSSDWISNNGNPYWANLNEPNQDGDLAYVYTDKPGKFTVSFDGISSGSYVRPSRVGSATFVATIRVNGALPTKFKLRLRHLGVDYDSDEYTITSNTYVEIFKTYPQLPSGIGWNSTSLSNVEFGLVYVEGSELRCTKLEVQVQTELIPHQTLSPDGNDAAFQDWHNFPGTASAHMSVGMYDGDGSYLYTDTSWNSLTTQIATDLLGVYGFASDDVFAVGVDGVILHWDGSVWTLQESGVSEDLNAVWGSSSTNVFAVGKLGLIVHWDGVVWSIMPSGILEQLHGVWGAAANNVFAVGNNGTILHYNGVVWSTMVSGTVFDLYTIWGADSNNIYAGGDVGTAVYFNGALWAPMVTGIATDIYGLWGSGAADVFAVGASGVIIRWNGALWAPMVSGTLESLHSVWGSTGTDVVVVGDYGTALRWDGVSWQEKSTDQTSHLYGVWGTLATHIFVVGEGGVSLAYREVSWLPISVFTLTNFSTPTFPANIDRMQASCMVKNTGDADGRVAVVVRSAGVNYFGSHGTDGWVIPADGVWHLIEEEFINDPSTGWPSGSPGYTPWNSAQADLLEVGVLNLQGKLRVTTLGAEAFQKHTPVTVFDLFPVADGYRQDYNTVFPAQPPGSNWQNVDEDPPDYGASYLGADAALAGDTQYGTFSVGPPIGAFPIGEQAYAVELRCTLRLGPAATSALVAPVIRYNNETYVGRLFPISNTGASWFDVKQDFFVSPFTGAPWTAVEVDGAEYGMVTLEGETYLTRVRVQAQTAPLAAGLPDPTDLRLTDAADAPAPAGIIDRSVLDGTIYAVTEFAVGTAGFNIAVPTTVIPVNTADVALVNEIYRGRIERITFDTTNYPVDPWEVTYWCRVPQHVATNTIGELGLFAEIIWSPIPAEIGTKFLFALMHMPCQCKHDNCAHFYQVTIQYP